MHFTTQENHKRRVLEYVNEVFWWVRHSCMSHREMLDLFEERVYTRNSWKRLTQNRQAYVRGVIDTHIVLINRNELDWRVYHPKHGHVKKEDYAVLEGKWSEVVGKMGAKFWKDTDKVWNGEPEVFSMYNQDPELGYRLDDVKESV